jgi:hypothetical protein
MRLKHSLKNTKILIFAIILTVFIQSAISENPFDIPSVKEFKKYFDNLDVRDWKSMPNAKEAYYNNVEQFNSTDRDSLYLIITDFRMKMFETVMTTLSDSISIAMRDSFYSVLELEDDDNTMEISLDYALSFDLAEYLTSPFGEIVRFHSREHLDIWGFDGMSFLSAEETRKKIVRYENMIKKYPEIPYTQFLKKELHGLVLVYLIGTKYGPMYDENGVLREHFKQSYEFFIRENTDCRSFPLIKKHYERLKENEFHPSSEYLRQVERDLWENFGKAFEE